jgi:LysM repeat protein
MTRVGLLVSNVFILAIIIAFVVQKPTAHSSAASLSDATENSASSLVSNPLDQLASANIALTVAQLDNLPEATAINNQADTQAAELAEASTDDNVISKPQVVETDIKSRADISNYVAQAGDTVSSVATKFGVTSNSIKWSNDLNSDTLVVGQN